MYCIYILSLTMWKEPWPFACVFVCVGSHSLQLDVIVAQHRAACRASRSPQGGSDTVKEGGGDFEISRDKCYHGIPSSIKRVFCSSHVNKISHS